MHRLITFNLCNDFCNSEADKARVDELMCASVGSDGSADAMEYVAKRIIDKRNLIDWKVF